MPTIPNCFFVEYEKLGVIGWGEAPASLGPAAYPIAAMNARANAAFKYPAHAILKAEQIRREYECEDPSCPDVHVELEATPEFNWRERFLGRRGDKVIAWFILEIEFMISCVDLPEDQEEDEIEPVQDKPGWEDVSEPEGGGNYGMFEKDEDGEIVWKPSKLQAALRQKRPCG